MQFDPNRAFPYPVLRPGVDDYIDGEFQASVAFQSSEGEPHVHLEVEFALSVDEIQKAIDNEQASFIAVVSCRDTYFRRSIPTRSDSLKALLPAEQLRGQVDVFPYVVEDKTIPKYSSKLINFEQAHQ
jgi:hypothetical protein